MNSLEYKGYRGTIEKENGILFDHVFGLQEYNYFL